MHPLNPENFGVHGIPVSFYDGDSVNAGYIVEQIATNRFIVTDGTTTVTAKLAPTTAIAADLASNPTYCSISIQPTETDATGGTFTVHYKADTATVVSGGSGFAATDTLALPSGAGVLTVATVSGSAIATATVTTPGDYTTLFSSPTTATRAAGTSATFTPHYGVDSVLLVAPGSSYVVGNTLTLATSGSATVIVDTVDGGGAILTYHVGAVGDVTALGVTRAVTGGGGTGATFTPKWKLISVTSSGGTGYNVNDTLIFNGITATTTPTAHISVATSHAATTVVVDTAGSGITVAPSSVTTSTTTATFTLTYKVLSVASSGGSGYTVNDTLYFGGITATTLPTAHISVASSGAATTTVVDTAGLGITVAATSVGVNGPSEYVKRIWDTKVLTTSGNTYYWTRGSSVNGSAFFPAYS